MCLSRRFFPSSVSVTGIITSIKYSMSHVFSIMRKYRGIFPGYSIRVNEPMKGSLPVKGNKIQEGEWPCDCLSIQWNITLKLSSSAIHSKVMQTISSEQTVGITQLCVHLRKLITFEVESQISLHV